MAKLGEVCRHVRSKNAGPFWITVDLFFRNASDFARYVGAPAIGIDMVAAVFDVDAAQVKRFAIPDLNVVKFSYPRRQPQGWAAERDMHGGQQYVRLLDVDL